jgi:hypothetical protein
MDKSSATNSDKKRLRAALKAFFEYDYRNTSIKVMADDAIIRIGEVNTFTYCGPL